MATAPWWWVPLITVIGAPVLGVLLYFFVPLLRVTKRLGIWLSNPPWWVSNGLVALFISLVVFVLQVRDEHQRGDLATRTQQAQAQDAQRLENLRFVRERAAASGQPIEDFSGFDLQCQDLSNLPLGPANFERADLRHADSFGISLVGGHLLGADLRGANMVNAALDQSHLLEVDFSGADLSKATLAGALLYGATLKNTVLEGADLTGAHFEASDTAVVNGHEPGHVNPANLAGADLEGARLGGANLSGANLVGADLANVDLTSSDLTGANLSDIYYDTSTKWPAGLPHPQSTAAPKHATNGPELGPGGCNAGRAPEPVN